MNGCFLDKEETLFRHTLVLLGSISLSMEQWENLDIDTSDLASFVRRCNTNKSLIPGPASNVQAVILNRNSKEPVNTQEFINNIVDENHRRDFDSNPWNWAQHFLHFHGNVYDNHFHFNSYWCATTNFVFFCFKDKLMDMIVSRYLLWLTLNNILFFPCLLVL